ncbi:hypothetical protein AUC45_04360 [Erythrobacter sp. YT30]|nr:hypothetical protein AUC45_04360 [Erythrobacter sp. YT30]
MDGSTDSLHWECMEAIHLKCITALAMSLSACACVPSVDEPAQPASPAPTPIATPAPAPTPTPTPVPVVNEPAYDNYLDAPQTAGAWSYRDAPQLSFATFGEIGKAAVFGVECAKPSRQIRLVRGGASSGPRVMTIQTETTERTLDAQISPDGRPMLMALIPAGDPVLDAMAITKGRVSIGVEGMRTLYVPVWVEISRVIEDCR